MLLIWVFPFCLHCSAVKLNSVRSQIEDTIHQAVHTLSRHKTHLRALWPEDALIHWQEVTSSCDGRIYKFSDRLI